MTKDERRKTKDEGRRIAFVLRPSSFVQKLARLISALLLWLLAVIGAIGVAVWLRLPPYETRLLVLAIAFIAFFGVFLPVVRWDK
jgi:hypothetical protein